MRTRREISPSQGPWVEMDGISVGVRALEGGAFTGDRQFDTLSQLQYYPTMRLGARLRQLRKARGWSQLELARRARVSQSYVSQLEAGARGRESTGIRVVERLAKALDLPAAELAGAGLMKMTGPGQGPCHICGQRAALTFEHYPPSAAGNRGRVEMFGLEQWLSLGQAAGPGHGRIQRRGVGAHTLCDSCNTRTGAWYVPEFVRWVAQGGYVLSQLFSPEQADHDARPRMARVRFSRVNRLRFLKQIVTMLFSVNAPQFAEVHPELVAFVLDPRRTGVPARYRFYLALFRGPLARFAGLSVSANLASQETAYVSEVAYPPFAYLFTLDTPPGYVPLGDITDFADAADTQVDVELDTVVGFGHTPYPGDYRSKAAVESEAGEALPEVGSSRSRGSARCVGDGAEDPVTVGEIQDPYGRVFS